MGLTITQAIFEVERRCGSLGLKDYFGEPLSCAEAQGCVSKYHDPAFENAQAALVDGTLDPDTYVAVCAELISQFEHWRFVERVERNLTQLKDGA
jgi:hypothetical protein